VAERIPLILDVDTGVDDALAIGYALNRPDAELLMLSTLAGNTNVVNATENSLRVLGLLGASCVPVHQGASRPLARPHRDAGYFHGQNGLGGAELPSVGSEPRPERGPAAIIRLVRQRPGEIALVCLGPLTNLAIALNVLPELPDLLRRLVVMGGSFFRPGNVTPHAEYNIWADPEAAQQVFATAFPDAIVVGLDVTHQANLVPADWQRASTKSDPRSVLLSAVCNQSFAVRNQAELHLHDPLATAVALDPSLVMVERGEIDVVLSGEEEGKTNWSPSPDGSWSVATSVEAERFVNRFLTAYDLPESR
jgi:inosine-uridine nucleoside N-ribohydrolase